MVDVTDNFNRASLGASWTNGINTLVISLSTVVKGSAAGENTAWWNADAFPSNHYSQVKILDDVDGLGALVRHQSGANTFYTFDADGAGCTIYECTAGGSFAIIGAGYANNTVVNDVIKLDATGSTLTPSINGTPLATRSDASITGGSPGIHIFATTMRGDDWLGGPITGGAAVVVVQPLTTPVSRVVGKFKPWFRQRLFNHALPIALNAYTLTAETGTLTPAGQTATLTEVAATPGTQLDPAKTSANITLSNVNRTATRTGGTPHYATTLSNKSGVMGELYVEVATTAVADSAIGVSNAMIADSDSGGTINWMGINTSSIGLYGQDIYYNNTLVGSLPTTPNANDVIGVYVDRPAAQIWFRNATKISELWWPNGPGFDISTLGSGALYFGFTLSGTDVKTVNFDGVFLDTTFGPPTTRWDGSPIAGSPYTLTAATGTLTASGQAVALRVARKVAAGLGTVTLAGQTAGLRSARRLTAGQGTLTLAGQTAALRTARKMPAGLGTLTLAGQAATLKRNYVMPASLGTITLAGAAPNLIYSGAGSKSMPGGLGVITLAGQTVTLRYAHKLVAGLGTLTLAGQVVTTRFAHRTVAGLGTLTLAGQTAIVRYARRMPAGQGTLTPSGQNVTLRYSRKMPAGLGTITLAGQTVNTIYSGAGSKLLPASLGVLTLAGQPVTVRYARKMPAARGTITLAGQTVALQRARKITAGTGSVVLEGKAANLIYGAHVGYTLTAATGVLNLTGCDVTMPITRRPPAIVQETLKFGRPVYVSRW